MNFVGNVTRIEKMSTNVNCGVDNSMVDTFAFFTFFISNIILGMGTAVYWTCGAAYLDDNARKNVVPVLLGKYSFFFRRLITKCLFFFFS